MNQPMDALDQQVGELHTTDFKSPVNRWWSEGIEKFASTMIARTKKKMLEKVETKHEH